jgi:enamine deaminase RidA (YjgF/YER057c/UK114 family)
MPFQKIQPEGMWLTPSYVHGLRAGNLLFVAGQVAFDEYGHLVGGDDPAAQTRQVFRNIERILKAAGAGFENAVKVTTYMTDRRHGEAIRAVRYEFFGAHRPPHTGVIVALGDPKLLVEVDLIAVLPERA